MGIVNYGSDSENCEVLGFPVVPRQESKHKGSAISMISGQVPRGISRRTPVSLKKKKGTLC